MKTIKIRFFIILSLIITNIHAQENANKFEIELNDIKSSSLELIGISGDIQISAHNSSKIIIESNAARKMPERAKGLKRVGAGGEDNTGLGLNLAQYGNTIQFNGLFSRSDDLRYKIRIPQNLKLNLIKGIFNRGNVEISGLHSDLELEVKTSDIKLTDITGPTVINSLSGNIDIVFSEVQQSSPFSIATISGNIDLSLPSKTPANLELRCMSGGIYTDLDIEHNKNKKGKLTFFGGGNQISGKINGGGVKFGVSAISGDIYLRKKK